MVDFYVYLHINKKTKEVFYVGKGKGDRAWNTVSGRSIFWKNYIKKNPYEVVIYQDNLLEWYALELETELILKYGRRDLKTGSLVNLTDGGEGNSGKIMPKEAVVRLAEIFRQKYVEDPSLRVFVSDKMKQRWKDPEFKKKILSSFRKRRRPVIMDEIICFYTEKDASDFLGTTSVGAQIRRVCDNKNFFCKGHIFRWADSDENEFYRKREESMRLYRENMSTRGKVNFAILKSVTVDGIAFISISSAARYINCNPSTLSEGLKRNLGTYRCKGFTIVLDSYDPSMDNSA